MSAATELSHGGLITEPLLLEIALRGQYPDEPLPGIERARPWLARKGNPNELLPVDESLLVSAVRNANHILTLESLLLGLGDQGDYFTKLFHSDFVNQAIGQSVTIVHDMLDIDDQACVAAPMAGALPLARYLRALGVPYTRIYPIEITGTVGAEAGKARIIGELPQAVKDPGRPVILIDDVIDVGTTVAVLWAARKDERLRQAGMTVKEESQTDFLNELKAAKSKPASGATYHVFARLCEEQNLIVFPIFVKNHDIIHALAHQCNEVKQGNVKWKNLQQYVIIHYNFKERVIGDVWVLGGGLLDIAIELNDVIERLPQRQRDDPRVLNWIGSESDYWMLRIGASIPGLVYLSSDPIEKGSQINRITELVAYTISMSLDLYSATQPQSLPASPVQI